MDKFIIGTTMLFFCYVIIHVLLTIELNFFLRRKKKQSEGIFWLRTNKVNKPNNL